MPDTKRSGSWVGIALVVLLVVMFGISMVLGTRGVGGDEEPFAGTDSIATEIAENAGAEPWFEPIFEAGSGEIESGLFALQAALGAGVLGFALGRLSRPAAPAAEDTAASPAP